MNKPLVFLSVLGLMISGCSESSDSEDIRTSGFVAHYNLRGNSTNSSVSCEAYFTLDGDGNNYIDLNGGDTVTCEGVQMTKSGNRYYANPSYSVGATYTITLTRAGEAPYSSTVVLPPAPAGVAPSGTTVTKGQPLTVSWTASGVSSDGVDVLLNNNQSGSAIVYLTIQDPAPEAGSLTFGSSQTQSSPPTTGNWNAQLRISRSRPGSMASGLSGAIEATNYATSNITMQD